jgi:hypothetical protein
MGSVRQNLAFHCLCGALQWLRAAWMEAQPLNVKDWEWAGQRLMLRRAHPAGGRAVQQATGSSPGLSIVWKIKPSTWVGSRYAEGLAPSL